MQLRYISVSYEWDCENIRKRTPRVRAVCGEKRDERAHRTIGAATKKKGWNKPNGSVQGMSALLWGPQADARHVRAVLRVFAVRLHQGHPAQAEEDLRLGEDARQAWPKAEAGRVTARIPRRATAVIRAGAHCAPPAAAAQCGGIPPTPRLRPQPRRDGGFSSPQP